MWNALSKNAMDFVCGRVLIADSMTERADPLCLQASQRGAEYKSGEDVQRSKVRQSFDVMIGFFRYYDRACVIASMHNTMCNVLDVH